MRILLVLLLLTVAASSFGQSMVKVADSIRRVRGIPCIGYVVFTSDKIIDQGVAGFRKYRTRDSVRIDDRFYIGTNTFAFTSWIAAKLVESGKIKWTTTYTQLFPQNKNKLQAEFREVALKDLLSNQSGLAPYNNINDFAYVPFFPNDIISQRRDFSFWLLQRPGLDTARKNRMVISVVGYGVAAAMLEKVSGMPWEKMLDEYINTPLGISAKTGWPNKLSEQQPWGHWSRYGPLSPEPPDTWVKVYPPIIPAIDVNITIADYARFLQEHLRGLRGEKAYLNKKTFDLLHFGIPDYSLGWQNASIGNDRISFHTGESQLFMTHVELIPEKNIGILVVGNNGESMGKGGVLNLCRLLREHYMR
ncbi:MAG TPA: serine hydrolase domain-containing protein [Chitinophagaceae bacterium]|nr:serine hydrolase domain-containing protein [Chitinophagaceae bacterium]